jgi:predicted metal-dependent phosphoesterase TrpH
MLTFTRNKVVSISRQGDDTLLARGILEDDIYGLEVEVALSLSDLEILSIEGKWDRKENRECPRAIPFLQEAVGYQVTAGFSQKVRKTVGRKACRLFADILLECCHAAKEAAEVIQWEAKKESRPDMGLDDFLQQGGGDGEDPAEAATIPADAGPARKERAPRAEEDGKALGGFIIDLHVHTSPASPCSSAPADDVIEEAKKIGLDGICLTDHNYVWPREAVEDLKQRHGFLVLRGNEITTDQGDMLVFGLEKDIKGIISLEELSREVHNADGFIIAAHPFRGFLTFGVGKLGLSPEKAMERPLFKWVDGVEVLNSKVTRKENTLASQVARGLGLTGIGGSDSHEVAGVGIYATSFSSAIRDERSLIEALKKGVGCTPLAFRKDR